MVPAVASIAPDLALRNQHGQDVALRRLRGAPVLLVFYPFAFSGVCSSELAALRDRSAEIEAVRPGTRVLAVSCDPVYALRALSDRDGIAFDLLSDFWPHGVTARAYGCFDETVGAATRGTFLIDSTGVVRWGVTSPLHRAREVDDYLAALAAVA